MYSQNFLGIIHQTRIPYTSNIYHIPQVIHHKHFLQTLTGNTKGQTQHSMRGYTKPHWGLENKS